MFINTQNVENNTNIDSSFNNNNNYISDKQIKKDFNGNNIKIKKFDNIDNDLCFKDNEFIYFSSNKLGENLN